MAHGRGAATPTPLIQRLLRRVVDYAGLFPPASLDMPAAVADYAKHRAGDDAWMLGRFVLPAARLDEFSTAAAKTLPREGAHSWALSALIGSDLEEDLARIDRFNETHRDARQGAVHVDTVELKTQTARDVARAAEQLDRRYDTYMEIPIVEDPAELVAAIAETTAKAKVRTGGVTADAFPPSAQVARFVARCIAHEVEFKATAGLHHPWRANYRLTYAPDSTTGTMFGFFNVLLCVAILRGGSSEAVAAAMLEESGNAVTFEADHVQWRDCAIGISDIEAARASMAAFGSCSIAEPISDLRNLGLM